MCKSAAAAAGQIARSSSTHPRSVRTRTSSAWYLHHAPVVLLFFVCSPTFAGTLLPQYDIWIRESTAATSYENDAHFVSKSPSYDTNQNRWSLIEWDLSGLPEITSARLEFAKRTIAVAGTVQTAVKIDSGISGVSWSTYQTTKLATEVPFESLGGITVPGGGLVNNLYASGNTASAADLAILNAIRTSGNTKLAITLKTESGAIEWHDGSNLGGAGFGGAGSNMPVRLVFNDEPPMGGMTFEAVADTWVRENNPTTAYNADAISVWSTATGDQRYGIVQFDISGAAGLDIGGATLELWRRGRTAGTSSFGLPLAQTAQLIDLTSTGVGVESQTWNSIQSVLGSAIPLETLGAFNQTAGSVDPEFVDTFLTSAASDADLMQILSAANGTGVLTFLFVADENATAYKADWGDGESIGFNAKLTLNIVPEPSAGLLLAIAGAGLALYRRR
jgi:hypothetical protein